MQYSIESFVECRSTRRVHRAYTGETFPLYQKNIVPSSIWEMENTPDKLWETGEKCVPVPNTSTIEVGREKEKILLLNKIFFKYLPLYFILNFHDTITLIY